MSAPEYQACGVDVARLLATLDDVEANPDIARFQFRASSTWVSRTHVQIPGRQS